MIIMFDKNTSAQKSYPTQCLSLLHILHFWVQWVEIWMSVMVCILFQKWTEPINLTSRIVCWRCRICPWILFYQLLRKYKNKIYKFLILAFSCYFRTFHLFVELSLTFPLPWEFKCSYYFIFLSFSVEYWQIR